MLAAVDATGIKKDWTAEASLEELSALCLAADTEVVGKLTQKMRFPSRNQYLGSGKMEELKLLKEELKYDTVVVDDELAPTQQSNMEDYLEVRVIDRVALILDIFARRARTHEGKLQVELAQYEYNLPRLIGKWSHLERLGAGIGTRGPGESQLETDKRIIRKKIARLKEQIEDVRNHRELYRQKRKKSGIFVVALVGYTNSGKSTLLNALSRSDVIAKNEMFSTLDPTTRRLTLPERRTILLSDTVGFIHKLPPTLVSAFRATLEELSEADLLLHVIDITSSNAAEQLKTVENILKDLELENKPKITALNKIDRLLGEDKKWDQASAIRHIAEQVGEPDEGTVLISAYKKWGFDKLLSCIAERIPEDSSSVQS